MDRQEFVEYVKERYEQEPNGSFDRFGEEYIQDGRFDIRVILDEESELTWGESYIGTNFGSTVDYGDTYNQITSGQMQENELAEEVRERIGRNPRQIDFVQKENREVAKVYTGVVVVVRRNGYAIYPDPQKAVEL